jgi:hypothetical protein
MNSPPPRTALGTVSSSTLARMWSTRREFVLLSSDVDAKIHEIQKQLPPGMQNCWLRPGRAIPILASSAFFRGRASRSPACRRPSTAGHQADRRFRQEFFCHHERKSTRISWHMNKRLLLMERNQWFDRHPHLVRRLGLWDRLADRFRPPRLIGWRRKVWSQLATTVWPISARRRVPGY